ncbi:aldose 1-epimerase family protein [Rhodococcus chondri]|uniref:Aldose 1-epimerase family protein n=1 Tax=Rhodococcus chondri TaxID=3065941 RepID=A0ABU7JTY9_9NOCA|nr:aldose 1-epimerase family protein [Rhodococcus sp. CC-R104]MEE2033217.1 aldose 1-epimerase family protein [Rhodococcus sp. CC-R104]
MSEPISRPIRGGGYRAEVSSAGGALRLLEQDGPEGGYRLTESWPANARPPLYSGTVLAPWPGRVRDGHFFFDGIEHQLAVTDPRHGAAVHGFAWHRDWTLLSHNESRIEQALEVGLHKGWPYQLRLTAAHEVGPGGLTVTLTATNVGGYHSPFGLGGHPYLRAGDAPLDECSLQVAAGTRLPLDLHRGLPNAYSHPVAGTEYDFTSPRLLEGVHLDVPYGAVDQDVDGRARHRLLAPDGRGVEMWAGKEFGWLHATTTRPDTGDGYPDRGRALALVPMTCPPDAFNLGIDLIVLQPEEQWTGQWGIAAVGPGS